MKLLAVETATDACSVALYCDGQVIERCEVIPRGHTQRILGFSKQVLAEAGITLAQIDAFGLGCGPGSFTGLRIAASVIQALALACDRPVVNVSTLQALAQGAYRRGKGQAHLPHAIFSSLDARMGQVYAGFYQWEAGRDDVIASAVECLADSSNISLSLLTPWLAVGSGVKAYLSVFEQKIGKANFFWQDDLSDAYPQAQDVAMLAVRGFQKGEGVCAERALPVYLRDQIVT